MYGLDFKQKKEGKCIHALAWAQKVTNRKKKGSIFVSHVGSQNIECFFLRLGHQSRTFIFTSDSLGGRV